MACIHGVTIFIRSGVNFTNLLAQSTNVPFSFTNKIMPNFTITPNQKKLSISMLYALCCTPIISALTNWRKSCLQSVGEIDPLQLEKNLNSFLIPFSHATQFFIFDFLESKSLHKKFARRKINMQRETDMFNLPSNSLRKERTRRM